MALSAFDQSGHSRVVARIARTTVSDAGQACGLQFTFAVHLGETAVLIRYC